MALLGPRCCALTFFSCGEWDLLVLVHRLLIAVASCFEVQALGLWDSVLEARGLSCHEACRIFPAGIELMSPALADGFLTTGPPGKPRLLFFSISKMYFMIST